MVATLGLVGALAAPAAAQSSDIPPSPLRLMDWADLLGRPLPAATKRILYGKLPDQFGDLWLPSGAGPFPVVLMVHGGCWQSDIANLTIMNYVAEDLRMRGIAVWNIEYRGIDRDGGGYPGTFQDVAQAADALAGIGKTFHLRTDHVVAVGHSAGGHLVFWLAARGQIGADSPLKGDGQKIAAAISLGGLPDLQATRALGSCGRGTIDALAGAPSASRTDIYADTSPAALPANATDEVLISGSDDPIAPPKLGTAYVDEMKAKGEAVEQTVIPQTGHVELITPDSAAWTATVKEISKMLHPNG